MAKLWVDDLRNPPDSTWTVARSSRAALSWLQSSHRPFELMSLDHDLGFDDVSRGIVLWLCEHPEYWPGEVRVHSANVVGRQWLEGMVARYKPEGPLLKRDSA